MTLRKPLLAGLTALALTLAGCSSSSEKPPAEALASAEEASAVLTIDEPWVKAADGKMTAVFGTIQNTSDEDVHVIAVSSDVAGRGELHETVDKDGTMMMQEMKDGFVVKAGESKELKPGGDHLMLMDLTQAIEPGQDVTITVQIEGGEPFVFTATGRSFTGAQEEYGVHGEDEGDMHSDHDDDAYGEDDDGH
ncbi:MAG: copper chaperone PCu(A)C [Bowdeniella nasicola]|nr:copper chaperone PCu(A)C [Bowdeniella nasicola]